MEPTTFELKYCERCGALGVRRLHSSESYCEPCAQVLTHYLPPSGRGRRLLRGAPALTGLGVGRLR